MSSYIANLAAFLTMQKRDVTIDSVEELAAQSRVKYGKVNWGVNNQNVTVLFKFRFNVQRINRNVLLHLQQLALSKNVEYHEKRETLSV